MSLSKLRFSKEHPFARIGDILKRSKNIATVKDDQVYKRVTVKLYGGGVTIRDEVLGKEIRTKRQFLLKEGQFLFSRIDARNGAFGIATAGVDNAIVTNDFPVFDVAKEKIIPEFFALITGSQYFFDYCQSFSSGTTNRQRLNEDSFLSFHIPLPPLSIQKQLVSSYQHCLQQAEEAKIKANELEKGIETYLLAELGIEIQKAEIQKKGLQFVKFSEISRWDIWNVKQQFLNSNYPLIQLGNLIKMTSGQFLPKKTQIEGNYLVYGGNGVTGRHNQFIYEGKRLVIGRVGEKCGNVHLVEGQYWITDNAFKVDKISKEVTYEYLELAIRTLNLNQFKILSAQPSISQSIILDLKIPLPPLSVQTTIVSHINEQKAEIKRLRAEVEKLRTEAKEAFENEVFEQ